MVNYTSHSRDLNNIVLWPHQTGVLILMEQRKTDNPQYT